MDEWNRSRTVLSDLLGEAVTTASVPGGHFASEVAEAPARAGFTRLLTCSWLDAVELGFAKVDSDSTVRLDRRERPALSQF